jgi:hypothetical protein
MLISISVTSVTSKRSCALDDGPSVKECETNGEQPGENRFETFDSVDSAILTKV